MISGNLLDDQPRPTYSALVGTVSSGARGRGAVYKKALATKIKNGTLRKNNVNDDFKVYMVVLYNNIKQKIFICLSSGYFLLISHPLLDSLLL